MNKHTLSFSALLAVVLVATASGAPTTDPLRHFRSTAVLSPDAEILSITTDLNGDGNDDWLISATGDGFDDGKGKLWRTYVSTADGKFISRSKPTMLPADMIATSIDEDTGEPILVSYHPDGIEHGVITRLSLVGGFLKTDPLARVEPMGGDEDYVKSLFAPANLLKTVSYALDSIEIMPGAEFEATGPPTGARVPSDGYRSRLLASRTKRTNRDKLQESTSSSVLIASLAWIVLAATLSVSMMLLFKRSLRH